nr:alpha/beta fold hydrolase [Rhodococcus rhodochrous]
MSDGVGAAIHRSTATARARVRTAVPGRVPEVLGVRSKDGTRIHTEAYGPADAPTIVLAHGILCELGFWRNQIRDLSDDYRVVAFDHRGHGRSQAAPPGRTRWTISPTISTPCWARPHPTADPSWSPGTPWAASP